MDKESIRSILANISKLANVVPFESEKVEEAIALLDLMVIEEKGLGYSIEEPAYPLSELPYYLEQCGAVDSKIFFRDEVD